MKSPWKADHSKINFTKYLHCISVLKKELICVLLFSNWLDDALEKTKSTTPEVFLVGNKLDLMVRLLLFLNQSNAMARTLQAHRMICVLKTCF